MSAFINKKSFEAIYSETLESACQKIGPRDKIYESFRFFFIHRKTAK
jgi:hypothetical protein